MLDLVIRGGTVVDGTGGPRRVADVGVLDGRVVAIGQVDEPAGTTIDADGLIVAPGFVDLHTHYDAQLFWDPSASPSPLHGVTTVLGGNCGFSLAPSGPDHARYLQRMMAKVEGMPLSSLEEGLDWSWQTFGEWLDRLEGAIGVNAGFLVGHSALRRTVMGDDAVSELATEDQVAAMVAALHEALASGALGFSTSQVHTHHDGDLRPVPSRSAGRPEIEALAAAVADHPGTTVEMIVQGCLTGFSDEETDLMAAVSVLSGRPVNWNVLGVSALAPERAESQLHASDVAAERGGTLVALTLPHNMGIRLSFEGGAVLEGLPGWRDVLALDKPERMKALSDPEIRRKLNEGAHSEEAGILRGLVAWQRLTFEETFAEENAAYEGRTVGDVAAERGQEPFDALLDVVVDDELRTGLRPPRGDADADWEARVKVWRDHRTVIGGSDAGAHVDMMCGAIYSTSMLEGAVRRRGLLSWEEAVQQLSDKPARLYGLRHRGRIAEGFFADLVAFDPETVGSGPERTRTDMPGGAHRLYAESSGVEHVLVNGTEIVRSGAFTGELPGRLLRADRDTDTVMAGSHWWPEGSAETDGHGPSGNGAAKR
ncbi:MAG TPA: amidohydrolase family protein [Acidimicrobiales bacterium]|nr:amidohydrolase family protein [Acidimicrobiales bacterium]